MPWIKTKGALKSRLKEDEDFKVTKFRSAHAKRIGQLRLKAEDARKKGKDLSTFRLVATVPSSVKDEFSEENCKKVYHRLVQKDGLKKRALFIETDKYKELIGDPKITKAEKDTRPGLGMQMMEGYYAKYDVNLIGEDGVYECERVIDDERVLEQTIQTNKSEWYDGALEDTMKELVQEKTKQPNFKGMMSVQAGKRAVEDHKGQEELRKNEKDQKKVKKNIPPEEMKKRNGRRGGAASQFRSFPFSIAGDGGKQQLRSGQTHHRRSTTQE